MLKLKTDQATKKEFFFFFNFKEEYCRQEYINLEALLN